MYFLRYSVCFCSGHLRPREQYARRKPPHILYRGDLMCPNDLAFSVTALAAAIAEGKSAEELALLASILMQLGDTLTTLSLQNEICKQK